MWRSLEIWRRDLRLLTLHKLERIAFSFGILEALKHSAHATWYRSVQTVLYPTYKLLILSVFSAPFVSIIQNFVRGLGKFRGAIPQCIL
jgi:hypothetical protein